MNIALFGGTFDPIHAGHLAAARAAVRRFRLHRILFVPTGNPPHKIHNHLTDYARRYAMVTLACAGEPRFVPSTIEAPTLDGSAHYSIDTVRAIRRKLRKSDRLFFLLGLDAFLDLPYWKDSARLLDLVEFIVVSRPGFDAADIRKIAPPHKLSARRKIPLPSGIGSQHRSIHLLNSVDAPVASRDIRRAIHTGHAMAGLVPPLVEEYILKEGLYKPGSGGRPSAR